MARPGFVPEEMEKGKRHTLSVPRCCLSLTKTMPFSELGAVHEVEVDGIFYYCYYYFFICADTVLE
jgi:hypothetical protein